MTRDCCIQLAFLAALIPFEVTAQGASEVNSEWGAGARAMAGRPGGGANEWNIDEWNIHQTPATLGNPNFANVSAGKRVRNGFVYADAAAHAIADSSRASLHVSSVSERNEFVDENGLRTRAESSASGFAVMKERLYFNTPDDLRSNTPVVLRLTYEVSGWLSWESSVQAEVSIHQSNSAFGTPAAVNIYKQYLTTFTTSTSGFSSSTWSGSPYIPNFAVPSLASYEIEALYVAYGRDPIVDVGLKLFAATTGLASADFSNSAYFGISSIDGYSFGSQTGVFLTQPVPEPSALWMLLAGSVGVGAACRRRKAVAPASSRHRLATQR